MGLFFSLTLFFAVWWFFRSPIPAAMAEGMRRNAVPEADPALVEALTGLSEEVRELREDVMELNERMDFSERVLADLRQRVALPGPSGRS